jgi:hypothetical protein
MMVMWRPRTVWVVCGAVAVLGCTRAPRPTYEYEPAVTFTSTGSEPLRRQADGPPPAAAATTPVPPVAPMEPHAVAPSPDDPSAASPMTHPAAMPADPAAAAATTEPQPMPVPGVSAPPAIPAGQRMVVTPDGALVSSDGKVLAPPGSVTPVQGAPAPPPRKRVTGWVHATD